MKNLTLVKKLGTLKLADPQYGDEIEFVSF